VTVAVEQGDVRVAQPPGLPPGDPLPQPSTQSLGPGGGLIVQAGASLSLASAGASVVVAGVGDTRVASRELKETARRYFYEILSDGDVGLIDSLFAPGFVNRNPLDGQTPDRAGVRQFVQAARRAFPDLSVSVDVQVAETRRVATRYTVRGTHRDTFMGLEGSGRPIEVTGITIFRVGDAGIEESWGYWELATLLLQVGQSFLPS
jgi:steroid delta-isomerase-like uncharacterized protein